MLTVQELNEIRSRVRQHLNVRKSQGEVKLVISSGTMAIARGSRQLMAAALDEMERINASGIQVQQQDLEVDSQDQPMVMIVDGEDRQVLKRVSTDEIRELVRKYGKDNLETAGA